MRVLLCNPSGTAQAGFTNPSLGLLYISGMLEHHGIPTDVIDACIEGDEAIDRALLTNHYDFVGVTCLTPARHSAINVLRRVKQLSPESKTVIGGVHPSIMHKQMREAYPFIDHVVVGDGEVAMLDLVTGETHPPCSLDDLPWPSWDKVAFDKYPARGRGKVDFGCINGVWIGFVPRISIEFSRSCNAVCTFCSTWWIKGKYRARDPQKMVDEIQLLVEKYGQRHFAFVDDAFSIDREKTLALCKEIVARKLRIAWHCTTRTDALDEELVVAMKEAGCYCIAVGIESGDALVLQHIHKRVSLETAEAAIRLCRKIGIHVNALMIVGNLGETQKSIETTRDWLKRCNPHSVSATGAMWIFPGTAVYHRAVKEGILDDSFWLGEVPFLSYTKEHSKEELSHFQDIIYSYSKWVSLKRSIGKLVGHSR